MLEHLNVALIGTVDEKTPPERYGGIERVTSNLAKGLVAAGVEVTLFATADSEVPPGATLIACADRPVRLLQEASDPDARRMFNLMGLAEMIRHIRDRERAGQPFDIAHNHFGPEWAALRDRDLAGVGRTPFVTTFHGPLLQLSHRRLFGPGGQYHAEPVVSISNSQREDLPGANYAATVYNAVDTDAIPFTPGPRPEGRFLFVGRSHPDKGLAEAIELTLRTGRKLDIVAKVDPYDQTYHDEVIVPLIKRHPKQIHFWGEADDAGKFELAQASEAWIALPYWPEPFGMVYAEAAAAGLPVVARPVGSAREIVLKGKTGLVDESIDELARQINAGALTEIDPTDCRDHAEKHFSLPAMTAGYLAVYQTIIDAHNQPGNLNHAPVPPRMRLPAKLQFSHDTE